MSRRPANSANPANAPQDEQLVKALMALVAEGKSVEQATQILQQEAIRENAIKAHGLATVRLAHGAKFKSKKKLNYTIGSLVGVESLKFDWNGKLMEMSDVQFQSLRGIEVDITASESCVMQIDSYRENSAVTTGSEYQMILGKPATFNKSLAVRFPSGHEFENEDVFLIDPNADHWDMSNWTNEENSHRLTKMQIQIYATGFVAVEVAALPSLELPDTEEELNEFFTKEGALSRKVQEAGIRSWQNAKATQVNAASEASLQAEMEQVLEPEAQAV